MSRLDQLSVRLTLVGVCQLEIGPV